MWGATTFRAITRLPERIDLWQPWDETLRDLSTWRAIVDSKPGDLPLYRLRRRHVRRHNIKKTRGALTILDWTQQGGDRITSLAPTSAS